MRIPGWLLRHTITVEPYLGQSAAGPRYGPPVSVRCFVDDGRRKVLSGLGEETLSESTVYCRLDVVAPPKSRVTVTGRTAYVIASKRRDGGRLATPDHLELAIT